MNWFKIKVQQGKDDYTYAGSSSLSLEQLVDEVAQGKFVRLENLVYLDRGEIKDWNTWDTREVPMVYINPEMIIAIQQFKADPRTLPR